MTRRIRRALAIAVPTLGIVLLAGPAHAGAISFITIDDTLPNDHVALTWGGAFPGAFTSFSLSSNCTAAAGTVANAGSADCLETSAGVLTLTGVGTLGGGNNTINVNIWEDHIGGVLSDTLSIVGTQLTSDTVRGVLTFRSDVEGGPALTPLLGGEGIGLFDFVETGVPLTGMLGSPDSLNPVLITATSDADVPEPSSMLLLGSGAVIATARRLRNRRQA
jgi:hypothetical protein